MTEFWLLRLIGAIALIGAVVYGLMAAPQIERPTVQLTTDPPVGQLLPFEAEAKTLQSPVRLTLQALDAAGQPFKDAKIDLQILSPAYNPLLTTDFPMAEGRTLLAMEADAPMGQMQIQQMLPIRGDYQLIVDVSPSRAGQFTPFQQTITLPVRENPVKYRNLGILVAVLALAGFVGGWAIGGQQQIQPGEIAPQRVRLLLSGAVIVAIVALLGVNLSSAFGQSHAEMVSIPNDKPPLLQSQGLELGLSGDDTVSVEHQAHLVAEMKDVATGQPVTDVTLDIKVTALEGGWTAFAYQGIPDITGHLTWQQQFFDGAPHLVQATVSPQPESSRQFQPFQVAQTIEVEGVAPPVLTRLITLFYLTGILLIGLAIGLWWRRPRINRA